MSCRTTWIISSLERQWLSESSSGIPFTFVKSLTLFLSSSNTLSGNRANPILNSAGKDDKNHSRVFRIQDIANHPDIRLTRGGMILIGLMSGGDYQQGGLAGCGVTTAHSLARCGFGDGLYEAAVNLDRKSLEDFLVCWRDELRNELRTNSKGEIGQKRILLANSITEDFPDIDVLLSYVKPITSESMGRAGNNMKITWEREPDLARLAGVCELYFEWGYKEAIIRRLRTVLWPSIVLRILRRAVLNLDEGFSAAGVPGISRKKSCAKNERFYGTPSKVAAEQISSLSMSSFAQDSIPGSIEKEGEERLIIKIHSSRTHAFTDGLPEYRLEIAPEQLVLLAESGIKGLRAPESPDEWGSDEGEKDGKNVKKEPIDPRTHIRVWMPACIVKLVEPRIVNDYENTKAAKIIKRAKKTRGAPEKREAPQKKTAKAVEHNEEPLDVLSFPPTENPTNKSTTVNPPHISPLSYIYGEDVTVSDGLLQSLRVGHSSSDEEVSHECDLVLLRESRLLSCNEPEAPLQKAGYPIVEQIPSSPAKYRKGIRDLTKKKGRVPTRAAQSGMKVFFPVIHPTFPCSSGAVSKKMQPEIIPTNSPNTSQVPIQNLQVGKKSAPSPFSIFDICATGKEFSFDESDITISGHNVPFVPLSPSKRKRRDENQTDKREPFWDCSFSPSESEFENTDHRTKFRKEVAHTIKLLERPPFSAHPTLRSMKSMDVIEIISESDSEGLLPKTDVPLQAFPLQIEGGETTSMMPSELSSHPAKPQKKYTFTISSDIIDLT